MADDTTPPDPIPETSVPRPIDIRAGRTVDFSTGKPAPAADSKPSGPPLPVPLPPAEGDPEVRAGQTLDFSTGKAPTTRRKPAAASLGVGPVVRETLDLSTAQPPQSDAPAPQAPSPAPTSKPASAKTRGADKKDRSRPSSSGSSLAELLDPETLARLRGEG